MADRVLRGSRLGAVSYETDRNHDLAPRQMITYRCSNGEEFVVPFSHDAEIPQTWICKNGMEGTRVDGKEEKDKQVKPPRTHWVCSLNDAVKRNYRNFFKNVSKFLRSVAVVSLAATLRVANS